MYIIQCNHDEKVFNNGRCCADDFRKRHGSDSSQYHGRAEQVRSEDGRSQRHDNRHDAEDKDSGAFPQRHDEDV